MIIAAGGESVGESPGDDKLTVDQIVSGQKELFRILVQRYEQAVYGMGLSFFRNSEDAADFVQEVFLKSFRSLGLFQGRSRFSTWLYRIAYNTAVNSIRRQKDYRSLAGEGETNFIGESTDEETPERLLLRAGAAEAVREAMKDLPERYRICVDLFFFYDRSYQEIEVITGYPVNTIKSHVFRAKKLLRKKLEGVAEGGIE
ncbi:MAG: sigma-70 family RNA polymerase sigma factor [Treponema sp.]|jgi:RNA polymerase sigma-70 factor (ECF subfamily)|nr:sigma-70 family RNA polymerase sigma factor [Treponema sp.]